MEIRDQSRILLDEIIQNASCTLILEKAIYNYTIEKCTLHKIYKSWDNPMFVEMYIARNYSIYCNLQQESQLLEKLKTNEITPIQLAFMKYDEMAPEKWKPYADAKQISDDLKYSSQQLEASTDLFFCRRCKKNKCTYYQLQTRSGDEGITTFVTCVECKINWKC